MAQLNWSHEALDWLEEIHAYIAKDSPRSATRVIDGIVKKAELLLIHPAFGTRLRIVPEGEIRMLLYGHYRIAYLLRLDGDVIDILGVFHGALDIDRYLP